MIEANNLEALLREWASIDPGDCRVENDVQGQEMIYLCCGDLYIYFEDLRICVDDFDYREVGGRVLWPLCLAIESKRWGYTILRDQLPDGSWVHIATVRVSRIGFNGSGNSPEFVLLSAYLQALKATA